MTSAASTSLPLPRGAGWVAGLCLAAALALGGCATKPDVVVPAKLLSAPPLAYPDASRQAGEEGTVKLMLHYDAQGKVQEVVVHESSGSARLDAVALDLGRGVQLEPGTRNGQPEAGSVMLPVRYTLTKSEAAPKSADGAAASAAPAASAAHPAPAASAPPGGPSGRW